MRTPYSTKTDRRLRRARAGERSGWPIGRETPARFTDAKRGRYPDRAYRTDGNATPDDHFRKGADKFWEANAARPLPIPSRRSRPHGGDDAWHSEPHTRG